MRRRAGDCSGTLELTYAGVGVVVGAAFGLTAGWIAEHWVEVEHLAVAQVRVALVLVGIGIGLRWPVGMYIGALRGLERQVSVNLLMMGVSTRRTAGIAALLVLRGGGILTYFGGILAIGALELAMYGVLAWRSQPSAAGPTRFEIAQLRSLWSFSGEVSLISLFATVMKQMDRVIIARLEPLASLGYYSVAATLSGGLLLCAAPVFIVVSRGSAPCSRGTTRRQPSEPSTIVPAA